MSKETKPTSKNTRRRLAWYIIPIVIIYLLFAFVELNLNILKWGNDTRSFCAFIIALDLLICAIASIPDTSIF